MVPVEKTNRTIKAILDKSVGEFWPRARKAREIVVEEVDPSWTYTAYFDPGDPVAYWVSPDGKHGSKVERSLGSYLAILAPTDHFALLIAKTARPPNARTVTIYIPQLDQAQMDVARDALILKDKQLIATALAPFGIYAGIARAILEHQISTFKKAANPKRSTKQIQREVDDFLRSQGRLA